MSGVNSHHLDQTFLAFSDPTRRTILARLSDNSATVTQIAEPFEMSLNAVSKHLRILERADLVTREVRWREHWITLNSASMREPAEWIDAYRHFWDRRIDSLGGFLSRKKQGKGSDS